MINDQKKQIRAEFIDALSDKDWDLISEALFEKQAVLRDQYRQLNCRDRDWQLVDDLYNLYLDISTFIIAK